MTVLWPLLVWTGLCGGLALALLVSDLIDAWRGGKVTRWLR